jgi:hypothetical protein
MKVNIKSLLKEKHMKTKILLMLLVTVSVCILGTGCEEGYSSGNSTDLYIHQQPNSADSLQAVGELAYQLRGKNHGVTPQQYNNNMAGLV